eukprot:7350309-Heterocapsa_arctica.AAC.1
MGTLSGSAPEVNFCHVFMVRGGVGPVEDVNMGVDGRMVLFGIGSNKKRQNVGGIPNVVEIRLIFIIKDVKESLGVPLRGYG